MDGKNPADRVSKLKKLTSYENLINSSEKIMELIMDDMRVVA